MIKINGVAIKQPKPGKFKYSTYNLTKSGRVASGKMTMEIVAKKRKFFFSYDVLSGAQLKTILDLIDGSNPFFTLTYIDDADKQQKSAIVYAGEISRTRFRTDGIGYIKNVEFNLIEQ